MSGRSSGRCDDRREHDLSPAVVRSAVHGCLGDVGVLLEHLLDGLRSDVLAAADDHVVAAAEHDDVPVRPRPGRGPRFAGPGPRRATASGPRRGSRRPGRPTTRVQNSGTPLVRICEHASVMPYVGATGTPASAARSSSAGEIAAPPSSAQRSAGGSRSPASSSRVSVAGTSETSVGPARVAQRGEHAIDVEALVHDRAGAVDRRAHQDRQAADVRERQAAEPALVGVDAERDRRAERAPEPVAVRQRDRARVGARARGVDDHRRQRRGRACRAGSRPGPRRLRAARRRARRSSRARCGALGQPEAAGRSGRRPPRAAGSRAARSRSPRRPGSASATRSPGRDPERRQPPRRGLAPRRSSRTYPSAPTASRRGCAAAARGSQASTSTR